MSTTPPPRRATPTGVPSYRRSFDTQDSPKTPNPSLDYDHESTSAVGYSSLNFASIKKYKYQPLREHEDVRILKIEPGALEDDIVCQLLPTSILSREEEGQLPLHYESLSYYWGTEEERVNIRIRYRGSFATQNVLVRSNLFAALKQLRDEFQEVFLWVDALCIDQENDEEKNDQVSKMKDIYNKATNVCIWLGAATRTSTTAMHFIKEILILEDLDKLIKDKSSKHKWHAFAELMRNRWFSRRWVIQELALARNASVHCGDQAVHWSDFADAVALFVTKLDQIKVLLRDSPFGEKPDTLDDVRVLGANVLVHTASYLFRKSPEGEILERLRTMETLVSTLLAFEATDPKDTVYAILSLAKDEPGHRIIPDYKRSLIDVYTDFVKSTVDSTGCLDIICRHWAPIPSKYRRIGRMPSWIASISGAAFGAPEDALNGRANGDSFVGLPDRKIYNASLGFGPASVKFGQIEATDDRPDNFTYYGRIGHPQLGDVGMQQFESLNIPRINTGNMNIQPSSPKASAYPLPVGSLAQTKIQPDQQIVSSPIYFHHWQPPTGFNVSPTLPSLPKTHVHTNEESSVAIKMPWATPHRGLPPPVAMNIPSATPRRGLPPPAATDISGKFPPFLSLPPSPAIIIPPLQAPSFYTTAEGPTMYQPNQVPPKALHAFVSDRSKAQIKSNGLSVSPSDLEAGHKQFDGSIHVVGFKIDKISELGPRSAEGLIFRECLVMGGWLPDDAAQSIRVPDELWRTLVADRGPDGSNPPSWYHRACLYCLAKSTNTGDINTGALIQDPNSPELMVEFLKRVQNTIWNRKFFRSESKIRGKKLFGLAPTEAKEGDIICILYGCSVPVVLRKHDKSELRGRDLNRYGAKRKRDDDSKESRIDWRKSGGWFELIGECYVYGLMDGEVKDIKKQNPEMMTEIFVLG